MSNIQNTQQDITPCKPKNFYSREYNYYWSRKDRWGEHSFVDPNAIVEQVLFTCGNGKLLDVGCGMGLLVNTFLSRSTDAYGIDIAMSPIKEANKIAPNHFLNGSIFDLPFADNSFDTICSTDCLEHISEEEIPKAISELYRVTKRFAFIKLSSAVDRDFRWHLTIRQYDWWEAKFLEAGFRLHPMLQKIFHTN